MNKFNINPEKYYIRLDTGHVFSGKQILKLLNISNDSMAAIILLSIQETDLPVTNPNSTYGIDFPS